MRATTYLQRQVMRSHHLLHEIADDLTQEELVTRVLPQTNLIAFDLWHITAERVHCPSHLQPGSSPQPTPTMR